MLFVMERHEIVTQIQRKGQKLECFFFSDSPPVLSFCGHSDVWRQTSLCERFSALSSLALTTTPPHLRWLHKSSTAPGPGPCYPNSYLLMERSRNALKETNPTTRKSRLWEREEGRWWKNPTRQSRGFSYVSIAVCWSPSPGAGMGIWSHS